MLIRLPSPTQFQSPPIGAPQDALGARLRLVLGNTQGKLRDALGALVWRLAVHPSQEVGRLRYTELSVGYIAKAAGVGRETARQAWHLLRERLGWFSVSLRQIRDMGAKVRRLSPGGRWGQHLLLTQEAVAAAEQVANELDLGPPRLALPDAPGWHPLKPTRRGRHLVACCPWHDDHNPSMLLNVNPDRVSGSGVCFGCTDDQGEPRRVYWRCDGTEYRVRQARSVSRGTPVERGSGTIYNSPPDRSPLGVGRFLLGTLEGGQMRRRASRCPDLLAVLQHAETRSASDRASAAAWWEYGREGGTVADQYVSVEPMAPTSWRTLSTRRGEVRVPDRWEPTETRWLLADLDGFTDAPLGDRSLALAGEALERWAQQQTGLSGRLAIVRTSHQGVQVVVELATPQAARGWHRSKDAQLLTRALDAATLTAVRACGFTGGHADLCVHSAGRLMRRPGWRVDKHGDLTRARLAYATTPKTSQPANGGTAKTKEP